MEKYRGCKTWSVRHVICFICFIFFYFFLYSRHIDFKTQLVPQTALVSSSNMVAASFLFISQGIFGHVVAHQEYDHVFQVLLITTTTDSRYVL